MRNKRLLLIMVNILLMILINACGSRVDLAREKQTLEIYQMENQRDIASMRSNRGLETHYSSNLHGYSRTEANALDTQFPVLPNPTLTMYVFPHIKRNIPIPGYVTQFKLYESDIYALPNEQ